MDKMLCCCLALGDWEGGHLVVEELGLIFEMLPGHVIIFDSTRLTHFNLHYFGHRLSVVLHTDKFMEHAMSLWDDLKKIGLAR